MHSRSAYAYGYSGSDFDRYADQYSNSTVKKFQKTYYTAKQTLRSRLGKKEDEYLVASDAELDAKLEEFKATKTSCDDLARCIENYQDYICELSQEENSLGRFLKSKGKADKTQAGKMMAAVGRVQSYTAQTRLALRVPLVRLYSELDVFICRAVQDTQRTVDAMEKARTEYRGSLLWMKKVSEELDPERLYRLENFRQVQSQVKVQKAKFDKLKLDCLQKIDLLTASRCNLFSLVLANYQNCLVRFWDKSSQAHDKVAEQFKGYQHYEFTIVKDLIEPSRRLAEQTAGGEKGEDDKDQAAETDEITKPAQLISLDGADEDDVKNFFEDSPSPENGPADPAGQVDSTVEDLLNLVQEKKAMRTQLEGGGNVEMEANEKAFLGDLFAAQPATPDDWTSTLGSQSGDAVSQLFGDGLGQKAPTAPEAKGSSVLPSFLLGLQGPSGKTTSSLTEPGAQTSKGSKKEGKMDAWFSLFAEIDPLQNPDAIGNPDDSQRMA